MVTAPTNFDALGVSPDLVGRLRADGIEAPFPIQVAAIPVALEGRDLYGQAQTGSGKTLAFALPTIQRRPPSTGKPYALIMVPTRELAAQVAQVFKDIAGDVRVMSAFGGTPVKKDLALLEKGIDVVVATPGRLADLFERGALDLTEISILILDEA